MTTAIRSAKELLPTLICVLFLATSTLFAADDPLLLRPDVAKALRYIHDHEAAQVEKQIAISQIPAPPFQEEVRAKAMAEEFRRVHLDNVEIDGIGNVLG